MNLCVAGQTSRHKKTVWFQYVDIDERCSRKARICGKSCFLFSFMCLKIKPAFFLFFRLKIFHAALEAQIHFRPSENKVYRMTSRNKLLHFSGPPVDASQQINFEHRAIVEEAVTTIYLRHFTKSRFQIASRWNPLWKYSEIHECAKKCFTCLRVNVLCCERERAEKKSRRVHKLTGEELFPSSSFPFPDSPPKRKFMENYLYTI